MVQFICLHLHTIEIRSNDLYAFCQMLGNIMLLPFRTVWGFIWSIFSQFFNGGERERLDVFLIHTFVFFYIFKKIQKFERAHIFTSEPPNFFFLTSLLHHHLYFKQIAKPLIDYASVYLFQWKNAWDMQALKAFACCLMNKWMNRHGWCLSLEMPRTIQFAVCVMFRSFFVFEI